MSHRPADQLEQLAPQLSAAGVTFATARSVLAFAAWWLRMPEHPPVTADLVRTFVRQNSDPELDLLNAVQFWPVPNGRRP